MFANKQVADIGDVVRQKADALMLSGESAMGNHAGKAVDVLRAVATRMEKWHRQEGNTATLALPSVSAKPQTRIQEEICNAAATMADNLQVVPWASATCYLEGTSVGFTLHTVMP